MKVLFSLLFILSTAPVLAQEVPSECQYSCSRMCLDYADKLRRISIDINSRCGTLPPDQPGYPPVPPPHNPPPPVGFTRTEFFRSDSCSNDLVAIVDNYTNCFSLANPRDAVWAVKINGQCHNIQDTTLDKACINFQNAGNPNAMKLYRSDSCSSDLIAFSNSNWDCQRLADTNANQSIWAYQHNGRCNNIQDMNFPAFCESFKAVENPYAVQFYFSDSCSSEMVAVVDNQTNCEFLARMNNRQVWGIRMNGVCQNIQDTDMLTACRRFSGSRF